VDGLQLPGYNSSTRLHSHRRGAYFANIIIGFGRAGYIHRPLAFRACHYGRLSEKAGILSIQDATITRAGLGVLAIAMKSTRLILPILARSWHSSHPPALALIHRPIVTARPLAFGPDALFLCGRHRDLWKMLPLMLAGLARVIGRGRANAGVRGHCIECVSFVRFYQLGRSKIQDAGIDGFIQVCGEGFYCFWFLRYRGLYLN
jgi:hypothetical protein